MRREGRKLIVCSTRELTKDIKTVFIGNFTIHKTLWFFSPLFVFAFNLGVINLQSR